MADEDIKKIAEDATTYPILTENVSFPAAPGRSGLSAGTAPLSQKVDLTLREILGWRPRNNDPKGFLTSLTQSFEIKDVEGHTQWKWRPRTYAAEADLGAITGAQASLYSRARAALDQALPLLDGLTPLRSDHDQEDIDSARAIVHSSLTELVYELSVEGGPRLSRVDGYFHNLLGEKFTRLPDKISNPNPVILDDPEDVEGQLGSLLHVLGLTGDKVNTVEEEQNLTNFFILVDTVNSLWLTWRTQRTAFNRSLGGRSYLGTQLVLLSRNLSVIAESVEEVYFAMDSVFLGPAERQVTPILFTEGGKIAGTIFVGELLDWVYRFAYEEGPRLLREGGKDGVINAFRPTLDRLTNLVSQAVTFSQNGSSQLVLYSPSGEALTDPSFQNGVESKGSKSGLHTIRVQRALGELHANLIRTLNNTNAILRFPGPEITFTYTIPLNDKDFLLTINGHNFQRGGKVQLKDFVVSPSNVTFVSSSELKVLLDKDTLSSILDHGLVGGIMDLSLTTKVINGDGQSASKPLLLGSFDLDQGGGGGKLTITTVSPNSILMNELKKKPTPLLEVMVTGQAIQSDAQLALIIKGKTVKAITNTVKVVSSNKITAQFDLTSRLQSLAGERSITVKVISGNQSATYALNIQH